MRLYSFCVKWVERKQTSVVEWYCGGQTEFKGREGGCPNVTLSTTNPTWKYVIVTLLIREEKPGTDEYPICKAAQTHPGKQKVMWRC